MSMTRRPFRIETCDRKVAVNLPAAAPQVEGGMSAHVDRIMAELHDLRSAVSKFDRRCPEMDPQCARQALWVGIEAIKEAIDNTKIELATIHHGSSKGAKIDQATDELGAVVFDTEAATEEILQAAEFIDATAVSLAKALEGEQRQMLLELHARATRIFESCNFQDITGQRIRKVVDLIQFVEERVARMADIWGGTEEVQRIATSLSTERSGDSALLNGPALATDENVVSQDDIDSLFA